MKSHKQIRARSLQFGIKSEFLEAIESLKSVNRLTMKVGFELYNS